ncbi:MAG: acyloxyacyl hydrolase [Acidobacteriia bacterium]|nr:acyloxyacyl hydrolase [Terriglobia bacterium]
MKFADYREQAESRGSVFQLPVGLVLLIFVAAGGTMEAQSPRELVAEPPVLGAVTQTRKVTGDFISETGPSNAHENSGLLSPGAPCAREDSAFVVDECPMTTSRTDLFGAQGLLPESVAPKTPPVAMNDSSRENSKASVVEPSLTSKPDFNRNPYYKNKLEFSLDGGWLPINIPFVFDVFLGDAYTMTSLRYTLVPVIGSLRWQINDVSGPWILRGNWDLELSGAVTFIPRGPETRYFAWIMGVRRNFVPRHGKIAPYFDGRVGLGGIDAKEPAGVLYAQGQDFTFTVNLGSGVRYNFNPRYSISAGLNWMHISNLYLSEPKFANYGINVYGPMFGINVRIGKPHHHASD